MVKVKEDLKGRTFGKLTVIEQAEDYMLPCGQKVAMWICKCNCEHQNQVIVSGRNLRDGHVRSCGCLSKEIHSKQLKKYNQYDLSGEYGIGWTLNTNHEFYFDVEDYDKIKDYCWSEHIHKTGNYRSLDARDPVTHKIIRMHYLITDKYSDHINLNTLDNRKENLRSVTRNQNAQNHSLRQDNTSGFSGVTWNKEHQHWRAQINANKVHYFLGSFNTKEEAIVARLQAELHYFGKDFAPQRHLFEAYEIITKEEDASNVENSN